jgi:hypothetical protein
MEITSDHVFGINTILHTKDGRRIGNAIVIGWEYPFWIIKTDYGNECHRTVQEIEEQFYIAFSDLDKERDGQSCDEIQQMIQSDHKHRVNI